MSYVFNKQEGYVAAWGFLPLLQGINEAIAEGYVIDVDHQWTGADYSDFHFRVYLKKDDSTVDQQELKKHLLAYAKVLDPSTNGQKYKTVKSLVEKISASEDKK